MPSRPRLTPPARALPCLRASSVKQQCRNAPSLPSTCTIHGASSGASSSAFLTRPSRPTADAHAARSAVVPTDGMLLHGALAAGQRSMTRDTCASLPIILHCNYTPQPKRREDTEERVDENKQAGTRHAACMSHDSGARRMYGMLFVGWWLCKFYLGRLQLSIESAARTACSHRRRAARTK